MRNCNDQDMNTIKSQIGLETALFSKTISSFSTVMLKVSTMVYFCLVTKIGLSL